MTATVKKSDKLVVKTIRYLSDPNRSVGKADLSYFLYQLSKNNFFDGNTYNKACRILYNTIVDSDFCNVGCYRAIKKLLPKKYKKNFRTQYDVRSLSAERVSKTYR